MSAADASSLSVWSALSLLGLILVILGVLFEGAEAFIWTISWFRRKRLSVIWITLPEPHIPRWAHRLDHVGWFILVVGLALETWGHIRVTDITSRENRRLTAKLDSTTQIAGAAIEDAAITESNNLVLKMGIRESFSQRAFGVNDNGTEKRLQVFKGINFRIESTGDSDSTFLEEQIKFELQRSGWMFNEWGSRNSMQSRLFISVPQDEPWRIRDGVEILTGRRSGVSQDDDRVAKAGDALMAELNTRNIKATRFETSSAQFSGVSITIGPSPIQLP